MQAELKEPLVQESPEVATPNGATSNGHAPHVESPLAPVFEGPRPHRFTREEWQRMAEAGLFQDRRVELIDGEILEMAPMLTPHAGGVRRVTRALTLALLENDVIVDNQMPFRIGESEPEPDVAVLSGNIADYDNEHPTTALLIIEISDTTLRHDRTIKASLYASAQVPDYWILNVRARQLEVRRNPQPDAEARFGWSYGSLQTLGADDSVALLFGSQSQIAVAQLLPSQS